MIERSISWLVAGRNRRLRFRGTARNDQWLHHRVAGLNLRRHSPSGWPAPPAPAPSQQPPDLPASPTAWTEPTTSDPGRDGQGDLTVALHREHTHTNRRPCNTPPVTHARTTPVSAAS